MRISIVRCDRGWMGWRWPALLVTLWLGFGLAAIGLSRYLGRPIRLCLFKNIAGLACPTCGFTRGMFSLLRGHPVQAWLYNPLLFSFLVVLGACVFTRLALGQGLEIRLTRWERALCWTVALVVFTVNWCYVIRYVG